MAPLAPSLRIESSRKSWFLSMTTYSTNSFISDVPRLPLRHTYDPFLERTALLLRRLPPKSSVITLHFIDPWMYYLAQRTLFMQWVLTFLISKAPSFSLGPHLGISFLTCNDTDSAEPGHPNQMHHCHEACASHGSVPAVWERASLSPVRLSI
ncbi:hypothetical protein BDN72DRAFT_379843 [Pluteus cervinus]|uniref:Uncharacterized protein n=1 Tax=Pluteus cervinus TaxID=181527 RepID=A0ACD3B2T3_9AGAR|nr:hypothetical protein BDN72DRAFT_379843 [Pluteus cervinus]